MDTTTKATPLASGATKQIPRSPIPRAERRGSRGQQIRKAVELSLGAYR